MKLFKLPLHIQKKILFEISYTDLFFLSLVSQKSTELIKSVNFTEITGIFIEARAAPNEFLGICTVNKKHEKARILSLYPFFRNPNKIEIKRIMIEGINASWCKGGQLEAPRHYHPIIYYTVKKRRLLTEVVTLRIKELFGKNVTVEIWTNGSNCLPENVPLARVRLQEADEEYTKGLIRMLGAKELFTLINDDLIFELYPPPEFYSIREIYIKCGDIKTEILSNFRGRRLTLYGTSYTNQRILKFFKYWRASDRLANLRRVCLTTLEPLDVDKIINKSEIKKFPMGVPPDVRLFDEKNYTCNMYTIRYDGIVGIMNLEEQLLYFHVMDYNEKQLLEKRKE